MKIVGKTPVAAALALLMGLFVAAQNPADMVGTWSGEATLGGVAEPDMLTLVLEMKDGKPAGHMTDQYKAIDGDIADVAFDQGVFRFTVAALFGRGDQLQGTVSSTVSFTMKVDGDSMKGDLEIPEMRIKGTWEATRQKK